MNSRVLVHYMPPSCVTGIYAFCCLLPYGKHDPKLEFLNFIPEILEMVSTYLIKAYQGHNFARRTRLSCQGELQSTFPRKHSERQLSGFLITNFNQFATDTQFK